MKKKRGKNVILYAIFMDLKNNNNKKSSAPAESICFFFSSVSINYFVHHDENLIMKYNFIFS